MDVLDGLPLLMAAQSRSMSPENKDGARGGGGRATEGTGSAASRDLGVGWKVSPSVEIEPGASCEIAEITGAGTITHIWLTAHHSTWRSLVLRAFWDGDAEPAIEVPIGDFFANGWCRFAQVSSVPVASNPNGGFNCYWPMPFRKAARLSIENIGAARAVVYYSIDYQVGLVPAETGYLHGQFRRSNPLPAGTNHVLVEGVEGHGHYVGTYLAWGSNSPGWWGEGEVKFFLDGDVEYPTICGTGTEDYFGGAWNFDVPGRGYTEFTTPYLGMPQVLRPDGLYESQQRFGLYRWHIPDPIRFERDVRVEVQALGWMSGGRYRPLADDIASTALFYLDRTSTRRRELPEAGELECLAP